MPRYFFEVENEGTVFEDPEGGEYADDQAAVDGSMTGDAAKQELRRRVQERAYRIWLDEGRLKIRLSSTGSAPNAKSRKRLPSSMARKI